MKRTIGVLPIGTAWSTGSTSGVVIEHARKDRAVDTYAAVDGCPARRMRYRDDVEVMVLSEPPIAIPPEIREAILKNG